MLKAAVKFLFLIGVFSVCVTKLSAQFTLTGKVIDAADPSGLYGASVTLAKTGDSLARGMATDTAGSFQFTGLTNATYHLRISYIGNTTIEKDISISGADKNAGILNMSANVKELKDVLVETKQVRVEQKGDTSEYNADAYKTHPDATAEDLINKMPGLSSQNGTVTAQGETVQKVLVDGKEFFGDDATLALKNLPAEVIDKVQVFDKMSDQAQFTGFDDGNSQKTLNIKTKSGKSNGLFGKVFGGWGYLDHYLAGGNLNWFSGNRRISVLELSNNVNQQNFASQDLLGLSSGGGGRRGGGGMGGRGGNAASNFLVGQQSGLNTTHSVGINYIDNWGKKVTVTGSYFFNYVKNQTQTDLTRQYLLSDAQSQLYKENSSSVNTNFNHRISLRMEYTIDPSNSFIFTPKISIQDNRSSSRLTGVNSIGDTSLLNQSTSNSSAKNFGTNTDINVLYRHKFKKPGRTFSTNVDFGFNNRTASGNLYSANTYYSDVDSSQIIDQVSNSNGRGYNINGSINYTEPITRKSQLQFNYSPSYVINKSKAETDMLDTTTSEYSILDSVLSNRFDNTLLTQRAGLSYRLHDSLFNFSVGVNYQNTLLNSAELFPLSLKVNRIFNNVLPNAMFMYRFTKTSNMRIFYRTSTNAPSINQLQNVINNSNPLVLSVGNPNLKQEYTHNLMVRFGFVQPKSAQSLFLFAAGSYTQNHIANSSFIAAHDTLLAGNVVLHQGSQLTQPVNLNGYWTARSFITYGLPLSFMKCNLNLNAGFTFSRSPGMINYDINMANTYNINGGLVISSNISEKVDFTVSYTANYNIVNNSIQPQSNSNYFNHLASVRLNTNPWKGLVISTDLSHSYYKSFGGSPLNESFLLWNAGLGYKFLKDKSLQLMFTGFDLLNQNKSVSRNVTETYVEDTHTQVLTRYFMVTLTYTFRNFKGAMPVQNAGHSEHEHPDFGPPPGAGHGPPPGGEGPPHD